METSQLSNSKMTAQNELRRKFYNFFDAHIVGTLKKKKKKKKMKILTGANLKTIQQVQTCDFPQESPIYPSNK